MRWLSVLVGVAACYSPNPLAGSPCDDGHPCPDPLVCSTTTHKCVTKATPQPDSTIIDDAPPDVVLIDSPAGPSNDLAAGATVLTASTEIDEDITFAHDDSSPPSGTSFCGAAGGRDVYFQLTNPFAQVWYFDTFGSDYDTVIRTFDGACADGPPGANPVCRNNQCGGSLSQLAKSFGTGDHCIVIDEATAGTGAAHLVLHIEKGGHTGTPVSSGTAVTDNTCNGGSFTTGSCGGAGPEVRYFTTACPGQTVMASATTCAAATTSATYLYAWGPGQTELGCAPPDAACAAAPSLGTSGSVSFTGAHLFWLNVDSASSTACGPYSVTITLQ
ncbi:MAG: hypothetical protein ACM31C_26435 [Acidobacteriota bacterium]